MKKVVWSFLCSSVLALVFVIASQVTRPAIVHAQTSCGDILVGIVGTQQDIADTWTAIADTTTYINSSSYNPATDSWMNDSLNNMYDEQGQNYTLLDQLYGQWDYYACMMG